MFCFFSHAPSTSSMFLTNLKIRQQLMIVLFVFLRLPFWQESPTSWPASSPSCISRCCSWRPSLRRRWPSCSAWSDFGVTPCTWHWFCTSCGCCWSHRARARSYVSGKQDLFFFNLRLIPSFVLSSEPGARWPSHGSAPQFHPPAHVIHPQVWVHRSTRSPAILLFPTVRVHLCTDTVVTEGQSHARLLSFSY